MAAKLCPIHSYKSTTTGTYKYNVQLNRSYAYYKIVISYTSAKITHFNFRMEQYEYPQILIRIF